MQPNYYNPYQNSYLYHQPQQSYAMVNGIDDAKNFIVNPNCTAFLRDSNSNMCFEKRADSTGKYTMKVYNLVEVEPETDYVKKADFDKLRNEIADLASLIRGGQQHE